MQSSSGMSTSLVFASYGPLVQPCYTMLKDNSQDFMRACQSVQCILLEAWGCSSPNVGLSQKSTTQTDRCLRVDAKRFLYLALDETRTSLAPYSGKKRGKIVVEAK